MRARALRAFATLAFAAVGLVGCIESLDPIEVVVTPRVLAMVADRPESAPGQDVAVDVMLFAPADVPRPLSLRFRSCLDVAGVLDASGLPAQAAPPGRDCDEQTLPEGTPYVVRGERTEELVRAIDALAALGGDAGLVREVLGSAGLAFYVDVDVLDAEGEVRASAYKRVAITTRAPTTNPPPPSFRLGDREIVTAGRFACAAVDGAPIELTGDSPYALEPILPSDASEEPWLEEYPIFDFTGGVRVVRENAYYTWLVSGGSLSVHTGFPPERGSEWRAPREPGEHALWLVVRDGHLGQSACRLGVRVLP